MIFLAAGGSGDQSDQPQPAGDRLFPPFNRIRRPVYVFAVLFYALLAAGADLWHRARTGRHLLPDPGFAEDLGLFLLYGAAAGGAVAAYSYLSARMFAWARRFETELGRLLHGLSWYDALVLAALSGIAEEAFFRGAMQPVLGLFWTSVIFGAIHMPPNPRLWIWPLFAFAAGLLLGWLHELTGGSLVAPVTAHFLINLINLYRIGSRRNETPVASQALPGASPVPSEPPSGD